MLFNYFKKNTAKKLRFNISELCIMNCELNEIFTTFAARKKTYHLFNNIYLVGIFKI